MTTTRPTAEDLNAILESGGQVLVATYGRSVIYKRQNAGMFHERGANLHVQAGRQSVCISFGDRLLVAIRTIGGVV